MYYPTNGNVRKDKELESWFNELSINGNKSPDYGQGKVRTTVFVMIARFCSLGKTTINPKNSFRKGRKKLDI